MAKTFYCDIVSAESQIYSGVVELIVAPGASGELGIYPGHSPLLTRLIPGSIRIVESSGDVHIYYASGGFLEVQSDAVTVLADTAIRADDIDEAAAESQRRLAEDALSKQQSEIDYGLASAQLAEATAQLSTVKQLKARALRG